MNKNRQCFSFIFIVFALLVLCLNSKSQNPGEVIIQSISFEGNKVTKDHIIQRELELSVGDTLQKDVLIEVLNRSRENLLNTALFNFVSYRVDSSSFPKVDVVFQFTEQWYIWPLPIAEIAERNFNAWWESKRLDRLNYGFYVVWENFRGRREELKLLLQHGFEETYGVSYLIPYINKSQTLGLGLSFGLDRQHEVRYVTEYNKPVYFKNTDEYLLKDAFVAGYLKYRRGIHNSHEMIVQYNSYDFSDTLLKLNPEYSHKHLSEMQYMTIYYKFKHDLRDYQPYPLKGHYIDVELEQNGVGLFDNSSLNLFSAKSTVRKYWKISDRFYGAAGATGKLSSNRFQPYSFTTALGYSRDFARGYELYVIDGQNFGLLKTNIKYALIPRKVRTFDFIPFEQFNKVHYALYLNVFGDAGYVEDKQFQALNPMVNEWLYGYGLGLDLVTYYDKVFRAEFSMNKKGESGVFFHFIAPI